MSAVQLDHKLSTDTRAMLSTLLYYDVFNYPLTLVEIWENCAIANLSMAIVQSEMKALVRCGAVFKIDDYYLLENNSELVTKRIAGNERAEKLMKKARRMSRFIARFPYVRAVCLSGSMSKGYVDEDSDIDYFIVTKPGRLWLARTFLIGFKKIFLLNSYKYFCLNYFVDTEHMQIEEKNLFTATELKTLLPTYGSKIYKDLYEENEWASCYLPNHEAKNTSDVKEHKRGVFKAVQESMLNNRLGSSLDAYFMRITMKFWSKKFTHFDTEAYKVAMKSRSYVSKHHPGGFQHKVMQAHSEKIEAFEAKFNVVISEA